MDTKRGEGEEWRFLFPLPESAPVQTTEWLRPQTAWPDKDKNGHWVIYWEGPWQLVGATAGNDRILSDFMALEDAEPDMVARFIEKWGTLGLCSHGLPRSHLPRRMWNELAHVDARPCELNLARPYGEIGEPLERWHHFARQAHALHRAARLLMVGETIPDEIREALTDTAPEQLFTEIEKIELNAEPRWTAEDDERYVANALQQWLNYGDVGMHVRWNQAQGSLRYGGTGLAGALALQLALTCTGTASFYTCSGCGTPYTPTRKPRAGEHGYCEVCQDGPIPNRDRQRRFRAKKRRRET